MSPDGCFILQGQVPLGNEQIYGPCSAQQLSFPSPASVSLPPCMAEAMNRLLCHLERGVLLWVAPDGVFIKRFCQGRVYWSGPMAQHTHLPNKLEREKTFKLLDIQMFLNGMTERAYFLGRRRVVTLNLNISCLCSSAELFARERVHTSVWDWALLRRRISRSKRTESQEAHHGTGWLENHMNGTHFICWICLELSYIVAAWWWYL